MDSEAKGDDFAAVLAAIQNSTVAAVENRTSRVGDRGSCSAVDRRVREVRRTVPYTGVSIQHWRRLDG